MILLFTTDPRLDGLGEALQACQLASVRVQSVDEARDLLGESRQDRVAVLDATRPAPFPIRETYRLLHESPAVPTLLLLPEDADAARLPVGPDGQPVDEWRRLPASVQEIALRVQALLLRAGHPLRGTLAASAAGAAPPRPRQGQAIAVFGPKGGVGGTTIAANLAVGLAQLYQKQVVAVDGDLWFGDLGLLLDLRAGPTISSLVEVADHLDLEALRGVLQPHPSGVQVLLGPTAPADVEAIPIGLVAHVVGAYQSLFDFVIVDVQPTLDEDVLQALEGADRIVLVTTPDIGAVRSVVQVLELAPTLGWADKCLVVLNRAGHGVQPDQLQTALGLRVDATIVSDEPTLLDAANHGVPVLLTDPLAQKPVTRDLRHLLELVAGAPLPTREQQQQRGNTLHWPWQR